MASVVGSSPSPTPFAHGATSHGYAGDFDAFHSYGDSPQDSSPYGQNIAPAANDPSMNFLFSDFLSGDDLVNFDGPAGSGHPSEPGFSMPMDAPALPSTVVQPSHSRPESGIYHLDGQATGSESERHMYSGDFRPETHQQSVHPFTTASAHRAFPPVTIPQSSHNTNWAYNGLQDFDFNNTLLQDLPSASSYTTLSTDQDPWSPVQQRNHGSIGSEANLFGPATELADNYAFSWQSSPSFQPIHTPSSTHSPASTHANLFPGTHSPLAVPAQSTASSTDKTPRPAQNTFTGKPSRVSTSKFPKAEPTSPPHYHARSSSIDCCSSGDASNSPTSSDFVTASDFVFVNKRGSDKDGSPAPSETKPRITTSPKSQAQPEFLTQVFDGALRPSTGGAVRRSSGKRAGGRSLGSHLAPEKAARAKLLREEGSCWLCCLQRDSCTPGEVCDRCVKRTQRATLEHGLGCDRTKLTELREFFVPDVITRMHEHSALKAWCGQHIRRWSGVQMKLKFHVIWSLPPIECEVYEFEPRTQELLHEYEWRFNPQTGRKHRVDKACPPLAMVQIEHNDRQRYDRYLNKIVDNHLERFAEICFDKNSEEFQSRLLRLMVKLKPDNREEAALLREIFRLLVVTYIMSRKATMAPTQRVLLTKLHSFPGGHDPYGWATSPRMANRQLKLLWCSLMTSTMDSVLKRLQQILRSSKGGAKWTSAFCCLLGLAMCFEYMQRMAHVVCDDPTVKGVATTQDMECRAEAACRAIDDKFLFVNNLFRWKYHRGFNPLRDYKDEKVQRTLGENALEFVRSVNGLMAEKYDSFLYDRQYVGISTENQEKYTSRLVARFLASFSNTQ